MGIRKLNFAALTQMTPENRDAALNSFMEARHSPVNGEVAFLDERILKMEQRYEMTSESMRAAFQRGELTETAEICAWLMLLEARDGLAREHSR